MSIGWLALGLGIALRHFVLQHWASTITHVPNARVAQQHPPEAALTTELLLQGEPTPGAGKAPLTLVEFSDFECPYCRQFHEQ